MFAQMASAFALIIAQASAGQNDTPPPRPCLSPDEAGAGAAVMLPEMVGALARGCERHLPETAFLRAEGTELVARWRAESAGQRQTAMGGISRMMGLPAAAGGSPATGGPTAGPPSPGMTEMMQGLEAGMAERLNPVTCKEASRFVEAIAPLPAQNIAQMVSAVMGFGVAMMPPKGTDGPPICRT